MKYFDFASQFKAIDYLRSCGWTISRSKIAAVTFASKMTGNHFHLKAWRGTKAVKPSFYYTFKSREKAAAYAAEFARKCQSMESYRAAQTAEKKTLRSSLKASDHWSVGDTVYTSWGYDQTNVEYYQITAVKPRSVIVRQIAANNSDYGQPGGGKIAPRRYEYKGPEIFCPLSEDGSFSAGPCYNGNKPSFRNHCSKWDGRPRYTSSDR